MGEVGQLAPMVVAHLAPHILNTQRPQQLAEVQQDHQTLCTQPLRPWEVLLIRNILLLHLLEEAQWEVSTAALTAVDLQAQKEMNVVVLEALGRQAHLEQW